ncbi:MAG: EAL domain-containing protein, partial [Clostridiales bacterium]|nr:EAL domain-containing protein [Clostridiales bacterium]
LQTAVEVTDWADKILRLIRHDWKLPQGEIYVSASIGITLIPEDGLDSHKILKSADAAMYEAKGDGKGNYKLFHEDMLRKVSSRSEMEVQLRKAIEKHSFKINYQPYYRISDLELIGMEALIRWNHPVLGNIPPSIFIPLAEEIGLIREIGQWVMETTCQQNKDWQEKDYKKLPVAVNVSQLQLEDQEFIHKLLHILLSTKLDPQYLHIEVTESCIMKSPDKNIELLKEINSMGLQISLDDFGTGYSSLNYLQNLPIDTVKIDKSFIDEIIKRSPDTLILSEIISIAHKLNMTVIAEGLEHPEQAAYLKERNCDYMQGYLMNKPLTPEQMEDILLKMKNQNVTNES